MDTCRFSQLAFQHAVERGLVSWANCFISLETTTHPRDSTTTHNLVPGTVTMGREGGMTNLQDITSDNVATVMWIQGENLDVGAPVFLKTSQQGFLLATAHKHDRRVRT